MQIKFFQRASVAAILWFAVLDARAANIVWTNASSGNWNAPANWNPNQVPGASDVAIITNAGTYTVSVTANAEVGSVLVGGNSGAQTLFIPSRQEAAFLWSPH